MASVILQSKKNRFALLSVMVSVAIISSSGTPFPNQALTRAACFSFLYISQDLVVISSPLARATDTGWQNIPVSVTGTQFAVASDHTFYIYDASSGSIYHSLNLGQTWELTATFSLTSVMPIAKTFYPSPSHDILFMKVEDFSSWPSDIAGLYKSVDSGQNWSRTLPGHERSIYFSPEFALDGTAFATGFPWSVAPLEIWKTTDWGDTWHLVHEAGVNHQHGTDIEVVVSPTFAQDRTVFAHYYATGFGQTDKSVDAGETWSSISSIYRVKLQAVSPNYFTDQTLLGTETLSSLALSQDGGATWQSAAIPDGLYVWQVGLRIAQSFEPITSTLAPTGTYRVYLPLINASRIQPLELWLIASDYVANCKLYRSRDNGATWQEVSLPEIARPAHSQLAKN